MTDFVFRFTNLRQKIGECGKNCILKHTDVEAVSYYIYEV